MNKVDMPQQNRTSTIKQQLSNNSIAIVSIIVAITSLAYNTWRNEATEYNRNVRTSSFQILMSLAELQLLTDQAFYGDNPSKYDPIEGWSYVLYVQDLAETVSPEVKTYTDTLHKTWTDHWQVMKNNKQSNEAINVSIEKTRELVLAELKKLN